MAGEIERMTEAALSAIEAAGDLAALDALRVQYLGKKGELTALQKGVRDVPADERPKFGAAINDARARIEERLDARLAVFREAEKRRALEGARVDITLPGRRRPRGHLSPLTQVYDEVVGIFRGMGFSVEDGPEVEDDYHNFTALNFPPDHPARDMQQTLFVGDDLLLRTHTSPVQIRVMETSRPPIRMICPGWVYRSDTLDASHSPMFSQVEGLLVDRRVTMGDLFGVLDEFVHRFFGKNFRTRFRPSFFPFTEPSAEMDVTCIICNGTGQGPQGSCRVCKGTGWKEILGSGLVDPNVFLNVGYDPEEWTGLAFGMGVERLAMFKYGVDEIRHFFEGDLRFVSQF
ncbi:MAG: phenylalanine--tRNA ligase subunit alpha [Deltaproteobacteria bacterium]|nr:phenylalanine--tRNA ligase subunit alpha [Deltaproteobacteria bacterium]